MTRRLPQYLRQERRRASFAQPDVAYLLGVRDVAKISRYEHGHHLPPLETALMYEAMFGIPTAELFAGSLAEARAAVRTRAAERLGLLEKQPETARNVRRKRSLQRLIA